MSWKYHVSLHKKRNTSKLSCFVWNVVWNHKRGSVLRLMTLGAAGLFLTSPSPFWLGFSFFTYQTMAFPCLLFFDVLWHLVDFFLLLWFCDCYHPSPPITSLTLDRNKHNIVLQSPWKHFFMSSFLRKVGFHISFQEPFNIYQGLKQTTFRTS